VELAARWILGLTFIYASFHKILSPADFAKIIYGYDLFPASLINLIAITLPFIELVSGLALISGILPRAASLIITVTVLVFIAALSINLVHGHEFDCGCFSYSQTGNPPSAWFSLIWDTIFLAISLQVNLYSGIRKICLIR
jgi:uncharacterized membrane protein YphA (DoxX/SURF4 family)